MVGGYADEMALVVIGTLLKDGEVYSVEAINAAKSWLESFSLTLAMQKTEAVLITKRRKRNYAYIRIRKYIITLKPTIKYLLSCFLSFR